MSPAPHLHTLARTCPCQRATARVQPLAHRPKDPEVQWVLTLFLLALLVLFAWFIAVAAFHVTAAGIHLLLFLALVLFAVGFIGRRFAGPRRGAV
jgi:hypothetical protein